MASAMTHTALALLFSTLVVSAAVPALPQAQPDFSGTWTMDEKRSGSPTQEGFVRPVVWTIRHSPEAFVLHRKRGDKGQEFAYAWQTTATASTADSKVVAPSGEHRASWDGSRLVIQTLQTIQGKTVTTRETLSLAGGELTVERVLEVEHGYTMKDAKNFNVVKDVFTRTTP
jgi:hypothetical protein